MKVVVVYGPPGGGKGTQARLIAQRFNLINFDTGNFVEHIIYDPKNRKSKIIGRQRRFFETGKLMTPSWILRMVKDRVRRIKLTDMGIVFSGSPRTLFEAFGDSKTEGLINFLKKNYGRNNLYIIEIIVPSKESVSRNSRRLVCSLCGSPILGIGPKLKNCPFCGAKLIKRTLDKPEIIKRRLIEYQKRTMPILDRLRRDGFKIIKVNGAPLPAQVFRSIESRIR